jgi:hypothetical protein
MAAFPEQPAAAGRARRASDAVATTAGPGEGLLWDHEVELAEARERVKWHEDAITGDLSEALQVLWVCGSLGMSAVLVFLDSSVCVSATGCEAQGPCDADSNCRCVYAARSGACWST